MRRGRKGKMRGGGKGRGGREEGLTPHFYLPSAVPAYNNKPRIFILKFQIDNVHYISWILLMFLSVVAPRICKLLC